METADLPSRGFPVKPEESATAGIPCPATTALLPTETDLGENLRGTTAGNLPEEHGGTIVRRRFWLLLRRVFRFLFLRPFAHRLDNRQVLAL